MTQEPTNQEILEAINDFAVNTEQRFDKVESEITGIKSEITGIKSEMVTKSYLDDKLADLWGNSVSMTRKEDNKVRKLINVLFRHQVISETETREILSMEPFPQS